MTEAPATGTRQLLVRSPAHPASFQAIVMAEAARNPDAAIRAARQACMVEPQRRRLWQNLQILLQRNGRWADLDAAVPRQPQPLPPRRLHPVDLDAGVARYGRLMDQLQQRSHEGWTPSWVEEAKWRFPLDTHHLANLRRSEVSGGTQTVPERPQTFPAHDFRRLYPDYSPAERRHYTDGLKRQYLELLTRLYKHEVPGIDWYDAAAVDDDRFGARVLDVPGLGTATSKSLLSAYYACRIMTLVPRNGVVLEIGGGFGALASRLLAIRPDVTCVLTDLPINMVLTHTYLTSLYGDSVAGLWEDIDQPGPGHRALVVPPWRLAALPLRVDLAVNTMSFQHMDERNHAFYGDAMKALGTRRIYHVNRNRHIEGWDTMVVTAERYGFMADYAVSESADLDGKWIEVIADARN